MSPSLLKAPHCFRREEWDLPGGELGRDFRKRDSSSRTKSKRKWEIREKRTPSVVLGHWMAIGQGLTTPFRRFLPLNFLRSIHFLPSIVQQIAFFKRSKNFSSSSVRTPSFPPFGFLLQNMRDSSSSMSLADQNIPRRWSKTFTQLRRPKSSWLGSSNPWDFRCLASSSRLALFLFFFFQFIHGIFAANSSFINGEFAHQNSSELTDKLALNDDLQFAMEIGSDHRRQKRQWGGGAYGQPPQSMMCPPQCFQCSPMHCQAYQCIQPQVVNMMRCCCRPAVIVHQQPDLKTACDGEEAVAACLNGLCGQGFFCNARKFCCRCQNGKSLGQCVNGLCPAGYACNTNNFCCAIGAGSVLGPCANGKCPEGYECGAGDLCYARTSNGLSGNSVLPSNSIRRNFPPIRRNRPRWGGGFGSGISSGGKRRRTQRARGNGGWSHRRFGSEGDDWWQQEAAEFIQEQAGAEDY